MFKIKNKVYRPTPLMVGISMAALILAAFVAESADSLNDMIVPMLIIAVFLPVILADLRHE